jgi:hypothetical protein
VPALGARDLGAGYTDGAWPDAAALAARFPHNRILRITTSPADNEGDGLDVEKGDARPADLPGWLTRRRAAGAPFLWGYCPLTLWQACKDACAAAGVREPEAWWVAEWNGDPTIPTGATAKQYLSGAYDTSSVLDFIPGFDTPGALVPPAIDPPAVLSAPLVDWHLLAGFPTGAWLLTQDGAVYTLGAAPYHGGANGQGYFTGRQAARFGTLTAAEVAAGKAYVILDSEGERYAFPAGA